MHEIVNITIEVPYTMIVFETLCELAITVIRFIVVLVTSATSA